MPAAATQNTAARAAVCRWRQPHPPLIARFRMSRQAVVARRTVPDAEAGCRVGTAVHTKPSSARPRRASVRSARLTDSTWARVGVPPARFAASARAETQAKGSASRDASSAPRTSRCTEPSPRPTPADSNRCRWGEDPRLDVARRRIPHSLTRRTNADNTSITRRGAGDRRWPIRPCLRRKPSQALAELETRPPVGKHDDLLPARLGDAHVAPVAGGCNRRACQVYRFFHSAGEPLRLVRG